MTTVLSPGLCVVIATVGVVGVTASVVMELDPPVMNVSTSALVTFTIESHGWTVVTPVNDTKEGLSIDGLSNVCVATALYK
jgi:hypothetical protein